MKKVTTSRYLNVLFNTYFIGSFDLEVLGTNGVVWFCRCNDRSGRSVDVQLMRRRKEQDVIVRYVDIIA